MLFGGFMKLLFSSLMRGLSSVSIFIFLCIGLLYTNSQITVAAKDASAWNINEKTSVRLISSIPSIGHNQIIKLGLQFKMEPNWKIYWRSPGDAGFPPSLNWEKSKNLEQIDFGWPLPTRFSVSGIQTIGYKNEVVFPLSAKIIDHTQKLELRANLDYLACNEICIPYKAKLSLDIPSGISVHSSPYNQSLINQYMSKIPGDGKTHKLEITSITEGNRFIQTDKNTRQGFITVKAKSKLPFINPDIFVEGPELIFFGMPKLTLSKNKLSATFLVPVTEEGKTKINESSIRLTLKDKERSAERVLKVIQFKKQTVDKSQKSSFILIIGFALLGGLILNLMPCVLPVISLKVLSLVSHNNETIGIIRLNFIATALGIIFSFLLLGIALISLKIAGTTIGWGIQFQHPWFIVGLTLIVIFFSFNLWGIFELRLPGWLNDLVYNFGTINKNQLSFGNNFLIGAFATILATPCSAPFLGTAIGFALAGSIIDIIIIFSALGVGMALPYFIIVVFPTLATKLPKPGVWMITVKRTLSIALLATAIWLLSILKLQIGIKVTLIVAAIVFLIGFVLKIKTRQKETFGLPKTGVIIASILAAFWVPYNLAPPNTPIKNLNKSYWQEFDPEAIPKLVQQGKTVFVDITAEWCITCKVNKTTVLGREEFQNLLINNKIIAMQGDWTRPNEKITQYLRRFNRFGIPFNSVYGPENIGGQVLPELLTTDAVRRSLKKASSGKLVF